MPFFISSLEKKIGKAYCVFMDDCQKSNAQFTKARVLSNTRIAENIFCLTISIDEKIKEAFPRAGQFYMLRSFTSQLFFSRPISVYHAEKKDGKNILSFLILQKGSGTRELCALSENDFVFALGPLGNTFLLPQKKQKVCLVSGGIGIAPLAYFFETLQMKAQCAVDFFASYKSVPYGLEKFLSNEKNTNNVFFATEDGSAGSIGMLNVIFNEKKIADEKYDCIFACGPVPMLSYVKKIAERANVPCFVSMENRMACGVGACLGCTIKTTNGKKRCCKDGPVFDAREIIFDEAKVQNKTFIKRSQKNIDLRVHIGNVTLQNPVIAASGTFGFAREYESVFDVNALGGISSKGLTLEARSGNDGCRIWETPSGILNSIGLQNPGVKHFIENELPFMFQKKALAIANLSGDTLSSYVEAAKLLDASGVQMIELNISCPNVSEGGAAWGMTCENAEVVVRAVRNVTKKTLAVKLTPLAPDFVNIALFCMEAGADALCLSNSFQGIAIDIENAKPVFEKIKAGFAGPAVRPMMIKNVWDVFSAMKNLPKEKRVPLIASGGIARWQDAIEAVMAGASAIEVGSATFANPFSMIEIIDGIKQFMMKKNYETISDFCGIAHTDFGR